MSQRKKIYVGFSKNNDGIMVRREVFRNDGRATEEKYGSVYNAVVGPFRTVRGAKCMVHYGHHNNPHIQHVSDAERIGKEYAADLATKGEKNY